MVVKHCRCYEQGPGPLEKQVFLTTELFLQPPTLAPVSYTEAQLSTSGGMTTEKVRPQNQQQFYITPERPSEEQAVRPCE